jgi:hypothetical protein
LAPPTSADLEVVAYAFDPLAKSTYVDPAAEIVDFIAGFFPGPDVNRILRAEGMAQF